jgi:hypothetical protein
MVRQSWINAEGASTLAAIDGALQSAGGFDAVWPEFVKDNWNRSWPPTQDYASWDKLDNVGRPSPSDATEIFLAGASDHYVQLSGISLPYLSAQYFWYRITDDSVHTIAFYNGVNFNLASKSVNNSPYTGQFDTYGLTPPASPQPGAKVQALMKYRGMDWQSDPVDLTTLPVVTLCRDVTAERLDEFVVIVSSSQYADPSATLQPPGEDPMIWFSNLPCWQLSGNATYTSTNDGVTETFTASNVVWQRLGAAQLSHPYQSFYVSSGTVRWSISGTDSAQCAYSGSATVSAAGYQNGLTIPAFATSGQLYRGVSQIVGIGPVQPFMETITCPNGGQSVARPAQWFVGSTVINFPHMVFDPTGASLANAETVGTAQYSWHFVSQPQP